MHCLPSFHDTNTTIGAEIAEQFGVTEMEVDGRGVRVQAVQGVRRGREPHAHHQGRHVRHALLSTSRRLRRRTMAYQKGEGKSVVIALGGNALGNTPQEQLELVKNDGRAHRGHGGRGHQRRGLPRQRPAGRHDQQRVRRTPPRNDGKTPAMPFPECRRHEPGLHRLPAVAGHPERHEAPRHHALHGLRRDADGRRPGGPGVPEPHEARGRLPLPRKRP